MASSVDGQSRGCSPHHHHRRADGDPVEEVDHIFVQHADAAVGGRGADRTAHRCRRAVNRDLVAVERDRPRAHRVRRRTAGNDVGQFRMVALDGVGRRPGRLDKLAGDPRRAAPLLAAPRHGDRIGDGGLSVDNEIELLGRLADQNRARGIVGRIGDDPSRIRRPCQGREQEAESPRDRRSRAHAAVLSCGGGKIPSASPWRAAVLRSG